ncbi:MAG: DUF2339 domain-containing protein [Ornithinibacter sp.]
MDQTSAVRDLESDFADAMTQMYAVGNGLARLRAELERATPAVPARTAPMATPAAPPPSASASVGASAGAPALTGPAAPRPVPPGASAGTSTGQASARPAALPPIGGRAAPREPWWSREGAVTKALALTGAVVTMAGVAMFLVIAAQNGWFGPGMRVTAGAALAAVLVALGVRGAESDRRTGAVGSAPVALVATGVTAAYLDVVAVTVGYGWIGAVPGLALAAIVAAAGLHLARRWQSELLAVVLLLGAAVLAPFVAANFGWVVSAFLAVLCLTGWYAAGERSWPTLTLARTVPVTLSLLSGAALSATDGVDAWGHLVVAAVLVVATLATSALAVRRHPADVAASVALGLLVVGLIATTTGLSSTGRTSVLALTAGALLVAATAVSRPPVGPLAAHLTMTAGGTGTVAAVLAVVSGAPDRFVGTGLLVLAIGQLAVAGATRSGRSLALAAGSSVVALLAWAEHPAALLTASSAGRHDTVLALLDSLLVGALVAVALWACASVRGIPKELRVSTTVASWVVGLTASATAVVALGTNLGVRVGDADLGFTTGQAAATVTWMCAATWLLLHALGRSTDAELRLRSGLLLSAVSVAKLFLYDLAALSGLVRSVAFIATGLLLLATGSLYAKAYERSRPAE